MFPLLLLAAGGAVFFMMQKKDGEGGDARDLFDADLPPDLRGAVALAAQGEQDPARLRAFRASLLPEFPKAAALLDQAAHQREQLIAAHGR